MKFIRKGIYSPGLKAGHLQKENKNDTTLSFMDHSLGPVSRILCLTQVHKHFLLFASRSIEVLAFTFTPVIHFQLNFVSESLNPFSNTETKLGYIVRPSERKREKGERRDCPVSPLNCLGTLVRDQISLNFLFQRSMGLSLQGKSCLSYHTIFIILAFNIL